MNTLNSDLSSVLCDKERGNTTKRGDKRGIAETCFVFLCIRAHFSCRLAHDRFHGAEHRVFFSARYAFVTDIHVSRPLEERNDHAARIRTDVGNNDDAAILEDLVCFESRRTVRALTNDLRTNPRCIRLGKYVLKCGGKQNVNVVKYEQLVVRDPITTLEIGKSAIFFVVCKQLLEVKAYRGIHSAILITYCNNGVLSLCRTLHNVRTDVTKPHHCKARGTDAWVWHPVL